jgi:hypothetical protein
VVITGSVDMPDGPARAEAYEGLTEPGKCVLFDLATDAPAWFLDVLAIRSITVDGSPIDFSDAIDNIDNIDEEAVMGP